YTFSYNGTNTTSSPIFNLCPNNYNYILTDDLGCSVSGTQIIAPAIEIIPGVITVVDDGCEDNCSGEVTITSNTGVNYTLNGISDPNGIFTGVCSGVYTIDISDANNCVVTATVVVGTMPQTEASFTMSSTTITTIDNEIEFINNSTNASVYIWTISGPDGYSETYNEEDINHTFPTDTGSYLICLTAINPTGCTDVICRTINVQEGEVLYVPNTFTPDGDEFNQTFRAYASGIDIYDFEMLIFNRWGEVIWESHDVSVGWDGTFHGRMVQDGMYNWKITFKDLYNDDRKTHYGHVNIMR
ncbi:MAG TPA: T9SS type B sorting domain-containing protein, partial [Crocinitomicaceae bacterium]|nr:T9SS type B sorting domain-containing protein [Crocinitomicaceae bacterium]